MSDKDNKLLLGIHASTAGGVAKGPMHGQQLECTAIQIFTKNQRQWNAPALTDEQCAAYFAALKQTEIRAVVAHDTYLINMASPDETMQRKSTDAFIDEIKRAERLKLEAIVFHPGSHMGQGEATGIRTLVENLKRASDETPGRHTALLIETTAGQGTNLGNRFEQIRDMLDGLAGHPKFGVAFDTCHLFGAGYDCRTKKEYDGTLDAFDRIVGLKSVGCIHLNDSLQPLGSRKDRHANIGQGLIGRDAFDFFINDTRFKTVPKILETPGGDEAYRADLKLLRDMFNRKGKRSS